MLRALLPTPGNVLFTLLVVAGLLWAQSAGALPQSLIPSNQSLSTGTIAYQGRLADSAGNPLTGTYNMIFRLYDVPTGGTYLWQEQWTGSNGVRVSDGLFNVMLGSLNPIGADVIAGHDQLWLGITVGTDDEMQPRVQLGSVPFAVQALTVPDGSITTEKIADGAVTPNKLDRGYLPLTGGTITGALDINVLGGGFTLGRALYVTGENSGKPIIGTSGDALELRPPKDNQPESAVKIYDGDSPANLSLSAKGGTSLIYAIAPNGSDPGILRIQDRGGPTIIGGNLSVNGTKSALVQTSQFGQRKLYAAESPEVRFFDEGLARLHDGVARVELDPIFLETIEGDYLVHITPYGDASLYVAEVGQDYFVVKAREGGPNVAFAWRLSATRKGYAGVRLERVEETGLR